MPDTSTTDKRLPKIPTQKRSLERFEHIVDCAEQLLAHCKPNEISIYEVAEKAELQAQSVYRLFPSAEAIVYAVAQRYLNMMSDKLEAADYSHCHSWQAGMEQSLIYTREFYEAYPLAMELILGASVPLDIRAADRDNVTRLAGNANNWFDKFEQYNTPDIRLMEIAIDIVDAIWSQSYYYHKTITPLYFRESLRAVSSYLELYLPRYLNHEDE